MLMQQLQRSVRLINRIAAELDAAELGDLY